MRLKLILERFLFFIKENCVTLFWQHIICSYVHFLISIHLNTHTHACTHTVNKVLVLSMKRRWVPQSQCWQFWMSNISIHLLSLSAHCAGGLLELEPVSTIIGGTVHGQVADLFTDQHGTALMFMHDVLLYCGVRRKERTGSKTNPWPQRHNSVCNFFFVNL